MGDLSIMYDLDRFLRSVEGSGVSGRNPAGASWPHHRGISFSTRAASSPTILHLDNDTTFFVAQASLDVGAIREQFDAVLEREYYRDFPIGNPPKHPTP